MILRIFITVLFNRKISITFIIIVIAHKMIKHYVWKL